MEVYCSKTLYFFCKIASNKPHRILDTSLVYVHIYSHDPPSDPMETTKRERKRERKRFIINKRTCNGKHLLIDTI